MCECMHSCPKWGPAVRTMTWVLLSQTETDDLSNVSCSRYQTHCFFLQTVLLNCAETCCLLGAEAHLALQWI